MGELKFHAVFSTLRYCHDICPEALLSSRQALIWRRTYQLITLPSWLPKKKNENAKRSKELQLNNTAEIILSSLCSYCYQSNQVIVDINKFCRHIPKQEFDNSQSLQTNNCFFHHVSYCRLKKKSLNCITPWCVSVYYVRNTNLFTSEYCRKWWYLVA